MNRKDLSVPEYAHIRYLVRRAVLAGELQRQPCEVCGDPKVEAHHEDYSNPLDVRWLCSFHHAGRHRYGESIEFMRQRIQDRAAA